MDVEGFISNLRTRALSPATVEAYGREVKRFQAFLKTQRLRVTQVTPKVVMKFIEQHSADPRLHASAMNRRLSAVSAFFDYVQLTTNGRMRNPVKVLHRPKRQPPRPRPADELVLNTLSKGITRLRDKAMLELFRSSGLRLSEVTSLDRDSIRVEEMTDAAGQTYSVAIGRVIGKGNKEREFLVTVRTARLIHQYLKTRTDSNPALFISNRKQRMSPRAVESLLSRWCRRLGLPRVHPHAIRHAAATRWHRMRMGTVNISTLLGHSSIAVTSQYIKPDLQTLRAEYFAAMAADDHRNPRVHEKHDGTENQTSTRH